MISVCLFLFLEIYISKLSLFVSIVILNFCQYWHLYIMDYKIMLTNRYLREINAKTLSLQKKNEYGSNKGDIGKMDGGAEASPSFGQASIDGS